MKKLLTVRIISIIILSLLTLFCIINGIIGDEFTYLIFDYVTYIVAGITLILFILEFIFNKTEKKGIAKGTYLLIVLISTAFLFKEFNNDEEFSFSLIIMILLIPYLFITLYEIIKPKMKIQITKNVNEDKKLAPFIYSKSQQNITTISLIGGGLVMVVLIYINPFYNYFISIIVFILFYFVFIFLASLFASSQSLSFLKKYQQTLDIEILNKGLNKLYEEPLHSITRNYLKCMEANYLLNVNKDQALKIIYSIEFEHTENTNMIYAQVYIAVLTNAFIREQKYEEALDFLNSITIFPKEERLKKVIETLMNNIKFFSENYIEHYDATSMLYNTNNQYINANNALSLYRYYKIKNDSEKMKELEEFLERYFEKLPMIKEYLND